MARVSAAALRDRARSAMLGGGGRGFMRFAPPGGALLLTDALRRCTDDAQAQRLTDALEDAGFICSAVGGMLMLTPRNELLRCEAAAVPLQDVSHPLYEPGMLAVRWMRSEPQALTAAGRQLVLEVLRLTWQPKDKVLAGLDALRAQAAAMLREKDTSGLYEAGSILYDWCREVEG